VSTIALVDVKDVLYCFFQCAACDQRWIAITQIVGNPHGVMNNLGAVAKLLLDTPEQLVPGAREMACECGSSPARLDTSILCRTNPKKGNDFHLRVRHGPDVGDDTFRAAVLFPDGRYLPVPQESLVRAIL
jgi:hypothetical protein